MAYTLLCKVVFEWESLKKVSSSIFIDENIVREVNHDRWLLLRRNTLLCRNMKVNGWAIWC